MTVNLQKKIATSNKRRITSETECLVDLKEVLPVLFNAFSEAVGNFENEIMQTPPQARSRGFEASLLNSKMIQSIQNNFPINWKFSKYKRFNLQINGYTILFKKLDKNNMPMNIKTNAVSAISNQLIAPLFDEIVFAQNPILFFGYQKNKFGIIENAQLVYIDEDRLKWTINEDRIVKISNPFIPIQKIIQLEGPVLKNKNISKQNISNK